MDRFFKWLAAACAALPALAGAQQPMGTVAAVTSLPTSIALTRHDAGTFYLEGEIHGYGGIKMLFDTGSSYLVINEVILGQLKKSGDARFARHLDGQMADGTRRLIPVYQLTAVRLGPDCWIRDVEAAVFPAAARPILGMNILSRMAPFTLSTQPPQLALNCMVAPDASEFSSVSAEAAPLAP